MMNDEGWWFQAVEGFADRRTDERTDICDCRVAFATENYMISMWWYNPVNVELALIIWKVRMSRKYEWMW